MKDFTLDHQWTKQGSAVQVTVRNADDGSLIGAEQLNPFSGKERLRFAESICELTAGAIDVEAIEKRLLQLCDKSKEEEASPPAAAAVELPPGQLIRPECFYVEGHAGIAVPRLLLRNGETSMQWTLCLRKPDGSRLIEELSQSLQLSNGQSLYVNPMPPQPQPEQACGWSQQSRDAWLAGSDGMKPEAFFEAMAGGLAKYLDLPPETAAGTISTLICWVFLTYIYPAFSAVPYLLLSGPAGSGKSRVLELLELLVFRPFSASNLTNAVLFRSLHSFGGTLLLDEAEQLRDNRSPEVKELMASLLAGYRAGKSVCRMEPVASGGFTVNHFCVYGPKAIACINEVPTPLASRCIQIPMFRSPPGSPTPRQRLMASNGLWRSLRDAAHALALDHGADWPILPDRGDVCPDMAGRDYELWQPLLSIAEWFESHGVVGLLSLLQSHALDRIASTKDHATPPDDEVLLQSLAKLVSQDERPTAKEVLAYAQQEEPNTFNRWSARGTGSHLRRYGLKTEKSQGRLEYRPSKEDLARIQANYGVDLGMEEASA